MNHTRYSRCLLPPCPLPMFPTVTLDSEKLHCGLLVLPNKTTDIDDDVLALYLGLQIRLNQPWLIQPLNPVLLSSLL